MLRDRELGLRERGLLATMLSCKDGWEFSIKGLASMVCDGEASIASSLKLLEAKGYLQRIKVRDTAGRIRSIEYQISDSPIFKVREVAEAVKQNIEAENKWSATISSMEDPEDDTMQLTLPIEIEPEEDLSELPVPEPMTSSAPEESTEDTSSPTTEDGHVDVREESAENTSHSFLAGTQPKLPARRNHDGNRLAPASSRSIREKQHATTSPTATVSTCFCSRMKPGASAAAVSSADSTETSEDGPIPNGNSPPTLAT